MRLNVVFIHVEYFIRYTWLLIIYSKKVAQFCLRNKYFMNSSVGTTLSNQMLQTQRIFFSRNVFNTILKCKIHTLVRNPNFVQVSDKDISYFESILDKSNVLTNDLDSYNTDFMGIYKGSSRVVLRPKTTEQVSQILKYCNSRK